MSGTDIGAHGARETPVPMPNTAVKPSSGYNTWPIKAWENSTVPNYKKDFRTGSPFSYAINTSKSFQEGIIKLINCKDDRL